MKIRVVKDGSRTEAIDGQWALEETVWDSLLDMQKNHPGSRIAIYATDVDAEELDVLFVGPSNTYSEAPETYPNKKHLLLQGTLDTETREVS